MLAIIRGTPDITSQLIWLQKCLLGQHSPAWLHWAMQDVTPVLAGVQGRA